MARTGMCCSAQHWGLQALKPEDSYDPEIELDIQQEAAKRFLRSLKQNRDRSVLEVRRRKRDREEYLAGVRRRNIFFFFFFFLIILFILGLQLG